MYKAFQANGYISGHILYFVFKIMWGLLYRNIQTIPVYIQNAAKEFTAFQNQRKSRGFVFFEFFLSLWLK